MSWSTRQSITKRLLVTVLGLLCTQVCGVTAAEVEQRPPALSLQEGASSTLQCNFSSTPTDVQWYRQDPGGRLSLLFSVPSGTKQHGRLNSTTVAKERRSSLYISSSQTADSATYFCAWRNNNNDLRFGAGTRLTVKPNITDPDPAVYQLKSPKSSKTSVCLFTDFDSHFNLSQSQEGTVIRSNTTVLDMRVMDSKSNGVLAWSNSTEFKCNSTFNEEFYSSSDFSCNATLIKKNFETDMNLNTRNLLVIGLRVLLLKVAGFDLFMTLRLWSR